ncbi:lysosome membrane protein 2-like isoform X2 [Biomphalaria glabrata]|uniref:Lysosome membrane protein 2-like isoform X2 n=1 Tax=Biomphalaria glabrata TaxID=6526 RepID=A0A9W3B8A4_BIOGL|nr:lysosome membrane protein 2-like isoform X2 [Biomphalaria glabrata]
MESEFVSFQSSVPFIRPKRIDKTTKNGRYAIRPAKKMSPCVKGSRKKRLVSLVVLCLSSLMLLVTAIVFDDIVDAITHQEMSEKLPIRNGSFAFKFWQKPPVPVSFNIYVFHITNPDEILAGTAPPSVIEKGPYVYMMHIEKTSIKWHDNDTVEYVQPQTFVFNRDASVGPDDENFTTINIPYITTATILQYEYPALQTVIDAFFISKGEDVFRTLSVRDIWWGYEDPVLEEAAKTAKKFNISSPLFSGRFGFYTDKNNTGDGLYNVYSGTNGDLDNFAIIDRWNGLKKLSVWKSDYANGIRGTDGSMHPPFLDTSKNLSIFDAYLHRSLKLVYNGTSSYRGIRTLRYYVPYSEFAANAQNPENIGYCTPDPSHCLPSGVYNLSEASFFAPMYVSLPHFVGGDPYYQKQVTGLRPSQSDHQPFYDIHELTGISMRAARRYQIVVRTQSFKYFTKFKNFPISYIPVLWIDGVANIDPDTANLLKSLMQDPMDALPFIRIGLFCLGGVLLLVAASLVTYWKYKSRQQNLYTRIEDSEYEPVIRNRSKRLAQKATVDINGTSDSAQASPVTPNSFTSNRLNSTSIQSREGRDENTKPQNRPNNPTGARQMEDSLEDDQLSIEKTSYYDSAYYDSFGNSGKTTSLT